VLAVSVIYCTLQLIFVNVHQALITFDQVEWLLWLTCNYLLHVAPWPFLCVKLH